MGTRQPQLGGRPWRERTVCHPPGISVPTGVTPIGRPPDGGAAGFRGAGGIGVRRAPGQASDGPGAELEAQLGPLASGPPLGEGLWEQGPGSLQPP